MTADLLGPTSHTITRRSAMSIMGYPVLSHEAEGICRHVVGSPGSVRQAVWLFPSLPH